MKELFDYCVKVDWNENKIAKYAAELGLTYEEIIEKALSYAEIYVDNDVYDQIIKKIDKDEEGYGFLELNTFNPVIFSLSGVKTYQIWRNAEEKRIVLQKIYEMWDEDNSNVKYITEQFGISREDVFHLLKMYAVLYLKITEDEWDRKKLEIDIKGKYGNYTVTNKLIGIYEALIKNDNLDDIINIIESSGYTTTYLRSHLHDYLVRYNSENYDKYMPLVISRFRMYNANKKEVKKQNNKTEKEEIKKRYVSEMLPNANKLVKMFIDSDCSTLELFLDKVKIKSNSGLSALQVFKECLKLVKENNSDLYHEYEMKLENEKKKYFEVNLPELLMIISLLKEGIEDNDIKRNFDIIDFFKISSLSLNGLLDITKEAHSSKRISAKDYAAVSKFVANNKKSEIESEKDITVIYNETRTVNVIRKSEEGVSNNLETIKNETKDKLITYLRNNNIPVNYVTYNAALTRYKMGYLVFEIYKTY